MSEQKNSSRKHNKRRLSFGRRVWYQICRFIAWAFLKAGFRIRYKNWKNVPPQGPALLVANHQSFLDPPAIGCGVYRHMNYLARKTLFKFKPFGWLIDSVDAIPLDQEGIGYAGIKETLRRLKNQESVLIFPEGARCFDGKIATFTAGYVTLAVRSGATIVPVAIAGAFEAFPRTKKIPSFFKRAIRIEYGSPITPNDYAGLSDDEIHRRVVGEIQNIFDRINASK